MFAHCLALRSSITACGNDDALFCANACRFCSLSRGRSKIEERSSSTPYLEIERDTSRSRARGRQPRAWSAVLSLQLHASRAARSTLPSPPALADRNRGSAIRQVVFRQTTASIWTEDLNVCSVGGGVRLCPCPPHSPITSPPPCLRGPRAAAWPVAIVQ